MIVYEEWIFGVIGVGGWYCNLMCFLCNSCVVMLLLISGVIFGVFLMLSVCFVGYVWW